SDSRSEPKVAYYDVWLPAGQDGAEAAVVDHAAAELAWRANKATFRLGVFGARGDGQADLVPEGAAGLSTSVRSGELQVWGGELEMRTASMQDRWSGQATYTLTRSRRNWGDG